MEHKRYVLTGDEPVGQVSDRCADDCPACFWEARKTAPLLITYTGKRVNPISLRPEDICIEDIAHHLATINRWCGALRRPISVAQHSLHVSWLCRGTGFGLNGLLHDASEAYLGDVSKWVKMTPGMQPYRDAEKQAEEVIATCFGISPTMPEVVEHYDRMMIIIEGRWGIEGWTDLPGFPAPGNDFKESILSQLYEWDWRIAERKFLEEYEKLTRSR